MSITQLGMFGQNYKVAADCMDCGCMVSGGTEYDGGTLCAICFDERDLITCANCGIVVDSYDSYKAPDDNDWCDECYQDTFSTCEHCDDPVIAENMITVQTGSSYRNNAELWCENCTDRNATRCDDCGDYVDNDYYYRTAHGDNVCDSCYCDNYFTCDSCGDVYHTDDYYGDDYGAYCEGCRPSEGDFEPSGFRNHSGSLTEIGSARCYGIELETDECDSYYDLEGTAWGAKDDPTVNGKEFFSNILEGDDGLQEVRDWGNLARRNGWRAGSNAGFHLHLDLRGESDDSMFAIAYAYRATEALWLSFVERRRRDCTYAMSLRYDCYDIEVGARETGSYAGWAGRYDRYNWANVKAYGRHYTIEIRLHQGTCNGDEVINWIKAHTRFADWAATKGLTGVKEVLDGKDYQEMFKLISREAWQDDELSEYYARKAASYR
jgi:hypothetical protein